MTFFKEKMWPATTRSKESLGRITPLRRLARVLTSPHMVRTHFALHSRRMCPSVSVSDHMGNCVGTFSEKGPIFRNDSIL